MSSYKFAIIGCGQIAERHAEQIRKHGQLVAVCDIVNEKANALATKYSAKAYCQIEELLNNEKEIDIVSICTPNGLHAPIPQNHYTPAGMYYVKSQWPLLRRVQGK
jgi:predicted dehydrogenase